MFLVAVDLTMEIGGFIVFVEDGSNVVALVVAHLLVVECVGGSSLWISHLVRMFPPWHLHLFASS